MVAVEIDRADAKNTKGTAKAPPDAKEWASGLVLASGGALAVRLRVLRVCAVQSAATLNRWRRARADQKFS
jgi:hypothetical protein